MARICAQTFKRLGQGRLQRGKHARVDSAEAGYRLVFHTLLYPSHLPGPSDSELLTPPFQQEPMHRSPAQHHKLTGVGHAPGPLPGDNSQE